MVKHRVRLSDEDIAFVVAFLLKEKEKADSRIALLSETEKNVERFAHGLKREIQIGGIHLFFQWKKVKDYPSLLAYKRRRLEAFSRALDQMITRLKCASGKPGRRAGITFMKEYCLKRTFELSMS